MSTADLYDLTIAAIVIVFAIRGYQKGLINQLGALLSIIAGGLVSVRFAPELAPHLWGNDNVKYVSAFIILILAATLAVWGLVNALSTIIDNLKLTSWNNQMGALLGVVYGAVCTMALTFVLLVFAVPVSEIIVDENGNQVENNNAYEDSFVMKSKTGPYLTKASLVVINHLPQGENGQFYDNMREYLSQNANGIKNSSPELETESFQLSTTDESGQDDDKPRLPLSSSSTLILPEM